MDRNRIKALDWSKYLGSMPLQGVVELRGEAKERAIAHMDEAFAALKKQDAA